MALEKAFIPLDLSGSLDTKTDQKMVLPTSLTELENGVFTSGSTITKRKGYSKLSSSVSGSTSAISSGDALSKFQNELLLFSDSNLYSYVNGREEWVNKGGSLSVNISSDDIIRNEYEQSNPDIAYGAGLYCIAWEDTQGGVRASVIDGVSGAILQNNTSISANGILPRCIELNQQLGIVYIDTSSNNVKITQLDGTDPTAFASATDLATNAATSAQQLDVITYSDNAGLFAYADSSGTITVAYITQDGATGTTLNGYVSASAIAGTSPEDSLAIYHDASDLYDNDIYVAYSKNSDSSGLKLARLNFDLTLVGSLVTIEASATLIPRVTMQRDSAGDVVFLWEHYASNDYDRLIKTATYDITGIDSGSLGSVTVLKRSVGLASKAFYYNSKTYFIAVHASDLQSTFFLLDTTGLIVGKLHTSVGGGLAPDSTLPWVTDDASTGIFKIPLQVKTRLVSKNDDIYSLKGISLSTVDYTQSSSFHGTELGENLHIAGGFVSAYDTQTIEEHGFHLYPEDVSQSTNNGAGSLAAGTYQYRVIYVWTDSRGQIHRSAPSVAVSASPTGGSSTVTLTIPTLRLTDHSGVTCEVYRTITLGTLFYKIGSVANDTTNNSVTLADAGAITDDNLIAKQLLYTNGGIVENISPPATSVMGIFNNRLFAVSSENPKLLYYSKKRQAKSPVEFSDVFSIVMNKAERVTGLMEMDEKLVIFEPQRIFYITGTGPTDAGLQNSFSEPQLVTGDVGCTGVDSLILTPLGIMFKSQKGIYLLDRKMETIYIGAAVEAYNDETISSAVMVKDYSQVRFTTQAGPCLVYDFYYGKWATFTNHSATGAVIWDGTDKYCYLRTSGGLVYQESDSYQDVDMAIVLKLTTAWIKTAEIQGLQRVRRALVLGDYKSNHILETRIAYNFEQFFNEKHSFNFADATGLNEYGDESPYGSEYYGAGTNLVADGVYQFNIHLARQKCDSVRFRFQDTVSSDPGQAYSITNLMLEVGMRNTFASLPQQKLV
jgi:hypothetical protein